MSGNYILNDQGEPVEEPDIRKWAEWFRTHRKERIVRQDTFAVPSVDSIHSTIKVSTVFLGIDHGWGGGPPLLYQTMIFGGQFNEVRWRNATRVEAIVSHEAAMDLVRKTGAAHVFSTWTDPVSITTPATPPSSQESDSGWGRLMFSIVACGLLVLSMTAVPRPIGAAIATSVLSIWLAERLWRVYRS